LPVFGLITTRGARREARGTDAGWHPKIDGRFDPLLFGIVEIPLGRL